jgi:hypothetical protein
MLIIVAYARWNSGVDEPPCNDFGMFRSRCDHDPGHQANAVSISKLKIR